jgi:hypothetical protein
MCDESFIHILIFFKFHVGVEWIETAIFSTASRGVFFFIFTLFNNLRHNS